MEMVSATLASPREVPMPDSSLPVLKWARSPSSDPRSPVESLKAALTKPLLLLPSAPEPTNSDGPLVPVPFSPLCQVHRPAPCMGPSHSKQLGSWSDGDAGGEEEGEGRFFASLCGGGFLSSSVAYQGSEGSGVGSGSLADAVDGLEKGREVRSGALLTSEGGSTVGSGLEDSVGRKGKGVMVPQEELALLSIVVVDASGSGVVGEPLFSAEGVAFGSGAKKMWGGRPVRGSGRHGGGHKGGLRGRGGGVREVGVPRESGEV